MDKKIVNDFVQHCKELDLNKNVVPIDYKSMSVCIIDCVYSLRTNYNVTADVVKRYAEEYMNGDIEAGGNNVTDLINNITQCGPGAFAETILKNKQKSGGVLKSEVCLQLAKRLKKVSIETIDDFRQFSDPELLEDVIRSVKGIGVAATHYLFMLTGDPNRCKPDIHVHECIRDACGKDICDSDCQELFSDSVAVLQKDYPDLTIAKLDGIIWDHYRK